MTNILSILIFLPIIMAIPIMFFKKDKDKVVKAYAFFVSIITFALSLVLYFTFNSDIGEFQFVEKILWIKVINSYYYVGIDGIVQNCSKIYPDQTNPTQATSVVKYW